MSFGAPRCGTFMMSTGRRVEVDRWIGRGNPLSKVLAQLITCKRGQDVIIGRDEIKDHERFRWLT